MYRYLLLLCLTLFSTSSLAPHPGKVLFYSLLETVDLPPLWFTTPAKLKKAHIALSTLHSFSLMRGNHLDDEVDNYFSLQLLSGLDNAINILIAAQGATLGFTHEQQEQLESTAQNLAEKITHTNIDTLYKIAIVGLQTLNIISAVPYLFLLSSEKESVRESYSVVHLHIFFITTALKNIVLMLRNSSGNR